MSVEQEVRRSMRERAASFSPPSEELWERIARDLEGPARASGSPPRTTATGKRIVLVLVALGLSALAIAGVVVAFGALRSRSAHRPLPANPGTVSLPPCSWSRVPTPNLRPSALYNFLRSVSVTSSTDAWAVGGAYQPGEGGRSFPLMLHWDGRAWQLVPTPVPGADLLGVSADSPSDVWVVGMKGIAGLIEHFDGVRWSIVAPADPGTHYWHFFAVSAVSPSDVWAVGGTATGRSGAPLIEHWDGNAWAIVPSQDVPVSPQTGLPYASLAAIDARTPGARWAVGEATNVGPAGASNTLIERPAGAGWVAVTSPDRTASSGIPYDHLFGVSGSGPTDAWAVGAYGDGPGIGGGGGHPLVLHWDGTGWLVAELPPLPGSTWLNGVAAFSEHEAWIVGSNLADGAVLLHWDGSAWTKVAVPIPAGVGLSAVSVAADGSVWAVGGIQEAHRERTFAVSCKR